MPLSSGAAEPHPTLGTARRCAWRGAVPSVGEAFSKRCSAGRPCSELPNLGCSAGRPCSELPNLGCSAGHPCSERQARLLGHLRTALSYVHGFVKEHQHLRGKGSAAEALGSHRLGVVLGDSTFFVPTTEAGLELMYNRSMERLQPLSLFGPLT